MGRPTRLPPSAVDDAVDSGDRLDRLERAKTETSTASIDGSSSWVSWDLRPLGSGVEKTIGAVVFPAGPSKLTVAGTWKAADGIEVEGVEVGVSAIDTAGRGGGGPIIGGGSLETYLAVGVVIVKRRTRAVITVRGTTSDASAFESVTGSVIVEPLPSII